MSDSGSHVQNQVSLPPKKRTWPKKVWAAIYAAGFGLIVFSTWLFQNYDKAETVLPKILRQVGISSTTPPQTEPAAQLSKEPQSTKKTDIAKPTLPCIDAAADVPTMLRALGGDKYEPNFNKHFRGRTTCFVLTLTDAGTARLQFITAPANSKWPPTFLAKPARPTDLKRFKPGTRLRVEGELVRYLDLDAVDKSDEIYVDRARLTEINDADGALTTGSTR